MSFRKEVRSFIQSQKRKDEFSSVHEKSIAELRLEIRDLRKINKDLLDRLMARNFEELKIYQESNEQVPFVKGNLNPDEDETTAGEVI